MKPIPFTAAHTYIAYSIYGSTPLPPGINLKSNSTCNTYTIHSPVPTLDNAKSFQWIWNSDIFFYRKLVNCSTEKFKRISIKKCNVGLNYHCFRESSCGNCKKSWAFCFFLIHMFSSFSKLWKCTCALIASCRVIFFAKWVTDKSPIFSSCIIYTNVPFL